MPELHKIVTVLGSTGSVGRQALDAAQQLGLRVAAIAASSSVKLLEEQIRRFSPELCAVRDENAAAALRTAVSDTAVRIISGENAVSEAAAYESRISGEEIIVVNAACGFAGLRPTLAAIAAGHDVALANKESLVAAGQLVMNEARSRGVRILPVDSEHCALFQCLDENSRLHGCGADSPVARLILTASGGPFRSISREMLRGVTRERALAHPTWKMGPKITVDCATMMNKGLEVIEAARLYNVGGDKIDVLIHPQSVVHSMVEFRDHAIIAQMGVPDMRHCVAYALCYPLRSEAVVDRLDLAAIGSLHFEKPDFEAFPLLPLAYSALNAGGVVPAALSAANEVAVGLFLAGKIGFCDIFDLVRDTVAAISPLAADPTLDQIVAADAGARSDVAERAASF